MSRLPRVVRGPTLTLDRTFRTVSGITGSGSLLRNSAATEQSGKVDNRLARLLGFPLSLSQRHP